ncbi:Branched-chain amino acid ABC-type transport system, permease component [Pyrobaculum oguniense TE7]|uniref:Branched-chain amino acid ABC-type transport system, permease component n=1 Tax=Pyrobaculum oguniense (strain DSM 13380 / JCM 10595 / TE7) TaxID=698757 RepID=H6QDJ8_PYROT|nr:Branched-chain amino acid ABC-type transport system, permease component [Pyrobaculum oguniense TE7]
MGYGLSFLTSVYLTWTFWKMLGFDLWLSIPMAVAATGLISMALFPVIRRYLDAEDYLLITLVLIFLIGEEVINIIYPIETGVYLPTYIFAETIKLGAISITSQYIFLSFLSLVIFVLYIFILKFTKTGLIIRAISQDLDTSKLFGVNVNLIYAMSLGFAVVAPAFLVIFYSPLTRLDPFMGFPLFITALQVAVLGGLGNLKGTLIAAYVIGFIHSAVGFLIDPRAMNLASLIAIIVILLIRPRGLARAESIW